MEHSKFRQLVREGENSRIDFKIECNAFASRAMAPRAELAKDICAMANNGYKASYLIVGVSDDGKRFKSVSNPNLTDDNLQDFCKKAIFPPPKIKVHGECWKRVAAPYIGKEFVIIQIGPQRRQVFRLAQDFVSYKEKTCHRRNEVWIRRGATSDLATPEEIVRLASGKPALIDETDEQREQERASFHLQAVFEQGAAVTTAAVSLLQNCGYAELCQSDWRDLQKQESEELFALFFRRYSNVHLDGMWYFWRRGLSIRPAHGFWKRLAVDMSLVLLWSPVSSLTAKDLKFLRDNMAPDFAEPGIISTGVAAVKEQQIDRVRRICLLPVLGSAAPSQITKAIPSLRRSGSNLHYYRALLRDPNLPASNKSVLIPSSSELFILDKIRSVSDFEETLSETLRDVENDTSTVITPT